MKKNNKLILKPWQVTLFVIVFGTILTCIVGFIVEGRILNRHIYMPIVIGGPLSYIMYNNLWKYKNLLSKSNKELGIAKIQLENLIEKSDRLLLNVLPAPIAERLKNGETRIADRFDEASVIFIDIVDFTKMSDTCKVSDISSTAERIVELLNEIYTRFDKIAEKYGLEKIKTIGDCYMAAAGIPEPRADHAEMAAWFAMEAIETMKEYRVEVQMSDTSKVSDIYINFRCGIDCGPVVAGVIGEHKFIYDVWGDTVNTAARMEEYSEPGKIQCSERFKDVLHLKDVGHLMNFEERGEIEIKGKGMMKTWFLNEK
ncbi:MAG: hypothetical protein QG635_2438 [Bacteroidota bacterium]|nr:hypothetical protein [Bacteroidota bacterium]